MSKQVGDKVRMTSDAVENYGEEYDNEILTITHVADKYMPSKDFFKKGMPKGFHPGYDEGAGGELYDFAELEFSLYGWELE